MSRPSSSSALVLTARRNDDGTIEGVRSASGPFSAVQFHPEGCPGPRDTEFLIDRFVAQVRERAGLPPDEAPRLDAGDTRDTAAARNAAAAEHAAGGSK